VIYFSIFPSNLFCYFTPLWCPPPKKEEQVSTQPSNELMTDQKLAEYLRKNDKNYSWDQFVKRTEDKGYQGNGIWREIIESSMRSRQEANDELGVSGWKVYNSWWRYFKVG